jgi:Uma2 family endonuclease
MGTVNTAERHFSIEEYLDLEDHAPSAHEFNNGIILEMAGGIVPHNVLKGELFTEINLCLRRQRSKHVILNSDTKLRIEARNRFVYPDITVSDGMPSYYTAPEGKIRRDIIVNPLLIVEVLSDETRAHDKGEKFEDYCSIPGFREYVLLEPETIWAKTYHLEDPQRGLWQIETLQNPEEYLQLRSIACQIALSDLYAILTKLPQGPSMPRPTDDDDDA